jgi:primosomal protein N' (replication factor Y) (superfamily II helicase)
MYVIEVIPLIRGTKLESLSYYSSQTYEIGTFLQVPIRGKQKQAIVTAITSVGTAKTALKAATFSLRKLPNQESKSIVPQALKETANLLSERYPASLGAILFSLLPSDIKDGSRSYKDSASIRHNEETTPQILTARYDERYRSYQSHIRSTFAKRGSVLFVVPTSSDVAYAKKELGQGIADRIITITATKSRKAYADMVEALEDTKFSKLIITTPPYAYCGRSDITSIIVEQSASAHYIERTRPYLDHREVLTMYAKAQGASIILGDTVIRTEEEAKRRDEVYITYGEEVKRLVFSAPVHVVKQNDKPNTEVPFQLFSPSLIKSVTTTLEAKGHVFLYSARRGLAPVVACVDCGYIFRCPDSHTPYSLVRTMKNDVEERWFVSSTSGKRVRAADVCVNCGSWRLKERGIGIQHIYDEWRSLFPNSDITMLDHSTASTPQKAAKVIRDFFGKKGAILIGTQVALPHLQRGVDMSAIISLDAARSTPTWRADESLFRLIMKLRECSVREVLIQTRSDIDPLVEYASKGAVERFFDDEIALRQQLKYPPFSTFILLTWSGTIEVVGETEKIIKNTLDAPLAQFYPNPHSTETQCQRHALIRIENQDVLTYKNIIEKVRRLPPYVKIEINPERIV